MITHSSEKGVTCTIVGDGMVGKTEICRTFVGVPTTEEYKATVTDEFTAHTQMLGDKYTIRIMDTSGQHEDYTDFRTKSYKHTDVFIVCYSVTDRDSFESVESFWIPEIRHVCKKTPIVLVATGMEIKDENNNVSKDEGLQIMNKYGLDIYVECTISSNENVKELFEDAVMSVIKFKKRRRSSLLRHLIAR